MCWLELQLARHPNSGNSRTCIITRIGSGPKPLTEKGEVASGKTRRYDELTSAFRLEVFFEFE
jgi:hypothetical protein